MLLTIDILGHQRAIVDDDAEHHDEAEERQKVHGDIENRHHPDGAQKSQWDTERYPERQTHMEEERQSNEHKRQPLQTVDHQGANTIPQDTGLVIPGGQGDPIRHTQARIFHRGGDGRGNLQGALVADTEDVEKNGRLSIESRALACFRKAVAHLGHIAQKQTLAVRRRRRLSASTMRT